MAGNNFVRCWFFVRWTHTHTHVAMQSLIHVHRHIKCDINHLEFVLFCISILYPRILQYIIDRREKLLSLFLSLSPLSSISVGLQCQIIMQPNHTHKNNNIHISVANAPTTQQVVIIVIINSPEISIICWLHITHSGRNRKCKNRCKRETVGSYQLVGTDCWRRAYIKPNEILWIVCWCGYWHYAGAVTRAANDAFGSRATLYDFDM